LPQSWSLLENHVLVLRCSISSVNIEAFSIHTIYRHSHEKKLSLNPA
jgi:hypothetical protein